MTKKREPAKELFGKIRSGATPLKWNPLDNAAKVFPPTVHGADTGVFRLTCELTEQVCPDMLQRGLDRALEQFPHMLMVLRHGLFWYYLEQTTIKPVVVAEHCAPCSQLYYDARSLLFEVSYWRNKINLEVFHVLSDGSGAFAFFRSIIINYLTLCHTHIEVSVTPDAAVFDRLEDGFRRYYQKHAIYNPVKVHRAYQIKGAKRAEGGLTFLEGVANVNKVLEAAHKYGATMTVYLTSVLFFAIHSQMYLTDEHKSVVLTIPVNLRSYFPSDTARNFFGTIRVGYNFGERGSDFEEIVKYVAQSFHEELTTERLAASMNRMAALEHQPFIRIVPLVLKNPVIRFSSYLSDKGETSVISNVGRFELPDQCMPYVRGLGVFMSTYSLQLCVSTCSGKVHFDFSSVFADPVVERGFFKKLVSDGVELEIRSSENHMEVN